VVDLGKTRFEAVELNGANNPLKVSLLLLPAFVT